MKWIFKYFSKTELTLWFGSLLFIGISFLAFDRSDFLTLFASIIGVTSLIFNAKGNPFGQILMILFSLLYGVISYKSSYYGEMITYLGMTMPMAVLALRSWLKNPYNGNKQEVKISTLPRWEWFVMWSLTAIITVVFYFVLLYFGTANIIPSTLSVTTSFVAVYLTFRRNPFYAIGYAANDVVLIVLWGLATIADVSYMAVLACFIAFLCNDIYGFINWRKMELNQRKNHDPARQNTRLTTRRDELKPKKILRNH